MSIDAWRYDHNVPFATLLGLLHSWFYPENQDPDADSAEFRGRVQRNGPEDAEIRQFKDEMRAVLEGRTEGLHPDAIFTAAEYDDGSDEKFLTRLWTDFYPGEPVPTRQSPAPS